MLYASSLSGSQYLEAAEQIGSRVNVYDKWISFLSGLPSSVHCVLVSCSILEGWQTVVTHYGLRMSVLAGNHAELHQFLVDDSAKELIVRELRRLHPGSKIVSFGDSGKYNLCGWCCRGCDLTK